MKVAIPLAVNLVILTLAVNAHAAKRTPAPNSLCSPPLKVKTRRNSSASPLAGWIRCKKPNLSDAETPDREWNVELKNGEVKIMPVIEEKEPVPSFQMRPTKRGDGMIGERITIRTDDGWLIGFNGGEFGGSLWWVNSDGKQKQNLMYDRVLGIMKYRADYIVVTGVAHLIFNEGKVWRIRRGDKLHQVKRLADLGNRPEAFFKESENSIIFVSEGGYLSTATSIGSTKRQLMRLTLSGKRTRLRKPDAPFGFAKSVAVTPKGVVYIGYGRFIERLTPLRRGFREEWFKPKPL